MRLLFFILSLCLTSRTYSAVLVSEIVGALTDQSVTSREVEISHLLDQAYTKSKTFQPLPKKGTRDFQESVAQVLLECMVASESESFGTGTPSASAITQMDSRVAEFLSRHPNAMATWKALGVLSKEKEKIIRRKIQSENFIEFKSKSSSVPVTDEEAKEYYLKNKIRFGSAPFEKFKENIRTFLEKRNSEARLREWFDALQRKYNVRNFALDPKSL